MEHVTLGKYRILAELGRGGMADVFLAMVAGPLGSGFSKLAVVKRLRQNLAEDPDFIAMLMDEARISARLNHPNVVQTHEVGVVSETYYLAMEYLDGQPLHRIQRRATTTGQKSPENVELLVVSDVLAGLQHAHELADYDGTPLNVVHRDVTPHNVFITYGGHVKIVDFGIAKAAGRSCETRQGIVKGKLRYMAPEQAMGIAIDRRVDVFAVGLLLWEAVTGQRFWGSGNEIEIARALIAGHFEPSPRKVNPDVPAELDRICQKAMAHAPQNRYPSAEAFRADLDAYLSGLDTVTMRRQLGAFVSEMFKKERVQLKEIVERAGRATAPVSVETLSLSRSSSMEAVPAVNAQSVRPTVLDVESSPPPRLPVQAPPPRAHEIAPPPMRPKSGVKVMVTGSITAGFISGIAAVVLIATANAGGASSQDTRVKATASRTVLVSHSEAKHVPPPPPEPEPPAPVVVTYRARPVPVARPATKPAPAPPAAVAASASSGDKGDLPVHVSHGKKSALDGTDPWKGLKAPPPALEAGDPWTVAPTAPATPTWGK